ncbi:hypothetical protein, partial [Xanthomonas sp. SHU 166]|uniref:hypothetical protein n=1 Tax=Xanthomonas sp. SHU 166 TaxID=1591170 RepID=UPI001E38582B
TSMYAALRVFPPDGRRFGREPGRSKATAKAASKEQRAKSKKAMATVTGYLLLRKRKRAGGLSPSRPLVPAGAAGVVLRRAAISASAG